MKTGAVVGGVVGGIVGLVLIVAIVNGIGPLSLRSVCLCSMRCEMSERDGFIERSRDHQSVHNDHGSASL